MNLYIDIETLPNPAFRGDIIVSPPGNMSKPETILDWEAGTGKYAGCKEAAIEEQYRKLGLDGTRGQIFCIAWAFGDGPVSSVSSQQFAEPWATDEGAMLTSFFEALDSGIHDRPGRPQTLKWIGHYITGFDLRFIWQRSVVNRVKSEIEIPYKAKPWDNNVFDTCIEWKGTGSSSGSLDAICKAFGIPGKGDMDGSKVYDAYLAGEYQKILDYCKDDVEKVRQLHKRMTFRA